MAPGGDVAALFAAGGFEVFGAVEAFAVDEQEEAASEIARGELVAGECDGLLAQQRSVESASIADVVDPGAPVRILMGSMAIGLTVWAHTGSPAARGR